MSSRASIPVAILAAAFAGTACGRAASTAAQSSYAVYAEYARDANKVMKNGLNRRVFNKVESQAGTDIALNADGSITLQPGMYHITGTSTVTMQTTFAPAVPKHDNTYPGYAMVYPVAAEHAGRRTIEQAIAIGTPNTALDLAPSVFDTIYVVPATIDIAVGHQSGDNLHDEVYLSIYDVEGQKSDYHAVARISIVRIDGL
jgi:hypothetical protein